jgi:tetratricopeptide (TPR) repeat protein
MTHTHIIGDLDTQPEPDGLIRGLAFYGIYQYAEALESFQLIYDTLEISNLHDDGKLKSIVNYWLGKTHLQLKHNDEAITYLNTHLATETDCADSLDSIGLAYHQKQEFVKAEEYYRKSLEIDANFASALHNLGLLKSMLQEHDVSRQCLERAYAIDSKNPAILHSLANLYDITGDNLLALVSYERGLKHCPPNDLVTLNALKSDYAEALNQFGHDLYQSDNFIDAEKFYSKALNLMPSNSVSLYQKAMCLFHQEEFPEARKYFIRSAIFNEGLDADDWTSLGICLQKEGKFQAAKSALQISLVLLPYDELAKKHYNELTKLLQATSPTAPEAALFSIDTESNTKWQNLVERSLANVKKTGTER